MAKGYVPYRKANLTSLSSTPWRCRLMIRLGLWNIGARLHPQTVTDSWYASDCDLDWPNAKRDVSRRDWLVWKFACLLRGC